MICEKCGQREGRSAVFVLNGVTQKMHLCRDCYNRLMGEKQAAKAAPIAAMFENAFNNMFNLLSGFSDDDFFTETVYECPRCGTNSKVFLDTGFVGCPYCYTEFAPIMGDVVARCQHKSVHVGKAPEGTNLINHEYDALRDALAKAIAEERFIEAHEIKAQMERLREGE